jgi:hypothetical protein
MFLFYGSIIYQKLGKNQIPVHNQQFHPDISAGRLLSGLGRKCPFFHILSPKGTQHIP